MKKVFLDTNIFIDFFDETRVNNEQAKQLIYFLISNEIKIVFSEDM
ncbi:DNA-binding protein, partial [Campylobacter jejuni]|nr:DNA-binding protein [Campylobacter jejuni]